MNPRLRTLVAIELSREIPRWQLEFLDNKQNKVTMCTPRKYSPILQFYMTLLSLGLARLFFLSQKRKPKMIRKVVNSDDKPFLQNYLNAPFTQYMSNIYSQAGEDGVILEICRRLNAFEYCKDQKTVIEFGAWDGKHLSNTFNLVESYGFRAFYIESEKERFRDLVKTSHLFPNITPINATISADTLENSLDSILQSSGCTKTPSILSIDIDSCDLDVWESLKNFEPTIVVIEINSSIPPGIYLRQGHHLNGNSFSPTLTVGRTKGYTLVAHTGNMIFVRDDLVPSLQINRWYIDFPELLFRTEEVLLFKTRTRRFTRLFTPLKKIFYKVSYKLIKITRIKV